MKSIDMGMKGYGLSEPTKAYEDETHYPEFHYCGDKEIDLPDEGVMEIRFRKVSEEERSNGDGKKRYSFTVCVEEILEVEGKEEVEAPATSGTAKNTEQALDEILKTMQDMVDKDKGTHERMDKIMDIAEEDEGEEEEEE